MKLLMLAAASHLIHQDRPDARFSLDPRHSDESTIIALSDKSANRLSVLNTGVVLDNDIPAHLHPDHRSLLFGGEGGSYRHMVLDQAAFDGTLNGDFTIEFYFKPAVFKSGSAAIIGQWVQIPTSAGALILVNQNQCTFLFGPYSGGNHLISFGTLELNTWQHLAVCRQNDTFSTYRNGKVVSSVTSTARADDLTIPGSVGIYYNDRYQFPQIGGTPLEGRLAKVNIFDYCKYDAEFTPK